MGSSPERTVPRSKDWLSGYVVMHYVSKACIGRHQLIIQGLLSFAASLFCQKWNPVDEAMSGLYKSCPASGQMNERVEKERGDKNIPFKLSATGPWCLVCDSIGKFNFVISWNYRFAFPLPDCFGARELRVRITSKGGNNNTASSEKTVPWWPILRSIDGVVHSTMLFACKYFPRIRTK